MSVNGQHRKKPKYEKKCYLRNKEKLMEDGGQYNDERIYPMVEIEVKRGDFVQN